jgi:transposase
MQRLTGYQIPHQVLEHYRFRAIELRKEGKKVNDIAHYFGLNRVTVSYWLSNYRKGGKAALKSKKAPGPKLKLSPRETMRILGDLKSPATDFGFETPLWTCKRVEYLIQKSTKKNLDNSNVWRLLRRLGLTNQKGERRALEQNPITTKKWLKEEWPKILAHAKRWQAMIYFQDEAGIAVNAVMGKTWAPKGKTPVVKLTGNRGGICVSSAISPAGRLVFRVEKGTVTSFTFIEFLDEIRMHHKNRKIIVIVDNAPPHIAKRVLDYAEKNKKSFAIYFLPTYSPELNPDEHVWGYLKSNKLKSHLAKNKKELTEITTEAMTSIQRSPILLKSLFYGLSSIYVK